VDVVRHLRAATGHTQTRTRALASGCKRGAVGWTGVHAWEAPPPPPPPPACRHTTAARARAHTWWW
jgi:hypothetical protein